MYLVSAITDDTVMERLTILLTTGNFKHKLADRGDDLYETPDVAVKALMGVEKLPEVIWEPACGPGSIVRVLREAGHLVHATDLVDYGCPDSESGQDFLMEKHPSFYIGAIVTNPPFKLASEFVAHAISIGVPKIIMLLRLAFMESERRSEILDRGLLSKVYVFARRIPMMHRHGYQGPTTKNSGMAFAWFVWDRDHKGPTELHRISWAKPLMAS